MTASPKLLELSSAERESLGLVHTLREILQQPQTWRETYQKVLRSWTELEEFLTRAGVGAKRSTPLTVLLVGAGTSDYIGKSVCALLQKEWSCNVQAVPSTDLLTNLEDHILPDVVSLWICFSIPGYTAEGVAVLEAALAAYPRIRYLVFTCNKNGKMARLGS